MSVSVYDLFSGLEQTIRERFRVIEDILHRNGDRAATRIEPPAPQDYRSDMLILVARIQALETTIDTLNARIESYGAKQSDELLPLEPMKGLEVVKRDTPVKSDAPVKSDVVELPALPVSLAVDQQNDMVVYPSVIFPDNNSAASWADVEEEVDDEENAEVELEEFEYRGKTYYRDPENNVFMTDDDGELIEESCGMWNETTKRIVKRG